jgi:hypothetical protein
MSLIYFLQSPELRQLVLHAYTKAISFLWIVNTPLCVACFILSLFIKKYTLKRVIVRGIPKTQKDAERADAAAADYSEADVLPSDEKTDSKESEDASDSSRTSHGAANMDQQNDTKDLV